MKKTFLLGFILLSFSAIAQEAQWDYTEEQTTSKEGIAYTKDGKLLNGRVKGYMYDYYSIVQFKDGKPFGSVNFYKNNGNFVGSASVPKQGNTLIASDKNNEAYKEMMASYNEDEFKTNQMYAYVCSCYRAIEKLSSSVEDFSENNLNCQDLLPQFIRNGIGKAEDYHVRKMNDKYVIETPFIAQKYRPSVLTKSGKRGMYVEIQRTGNAIFSFKDKE